MWISAKTLKLWVPFLLSVTFIITPLIFYEIALPQLALRRACFEHDFPEDCNEDVAIKSISSLSLLSALIPGIVSLITLPIYAAYSDRIGRKRLMALGLISPTLVSFVYYLLFNTKTQWILKHWRLLIIVLQSIGTLLGGTSVLNFVFYSSLSDTSKLNPSARTSMFVFMGLATSLMGVAGTQGAGYMLTNISNAAITIVIFASFVALLPFTLLVYPETVSKEAKEAPIITENLTIIGPLKYLFHSCSKTGSTALQNDFDRVYQYLKNVQNEPFLLQQANINSEEGLQQRLLVSNESYSDEIALNCDIRAKSSDDSEYPPTFSDIYNNTHNHNDDHYLNSELTQRRRGTSHAEKKTNTNDNNTLVLSSNVIDQKPDISTLPPVRNIPHRNNIPIFSLLIASTLIISVGISVATYYYLKQQWNITPKKFSDVNSYATLAGCLASFLLFPLFQYCFKTPNQELWSFFMMYVLISGLFGVMAWTSSYTIFVIANIGTNVLVAFPAAIARSAILTNVSAQGQGLILTLFAVIQGVSTLLGYLVINSIWIRVQDHHSWAMWASLAIGVFILALVPILFRTDNTADFNLRVEMIKMHTALTKWEEDQQAQKELEIQSKKDNEIGHDSTESHLEQPERAEPLLFEQQKEAEQVLFDHMTIAAH